MADIDYEKLASAIVTANRMSGGTVTTGGSGAGSASSQSVLDYLNPFKQLNIVVDSVTTGLSKMAFGTYKFTDALNNVKEFTSLLGPIGTLFNSTLGKSAGVLYDLNEQLKKSSESGAYFGNSVLDFSETITAARMSTDQYLTFIKENGKNINVMGAGADNATKRFLELSKTFQESNPIIQNFLKLGGTTEEVNEALTLTALGMRAVNYQDEKTMITVQNTAANLVKEFDDLARITGTSRKQAEEEVKKELSKAQVSAYIDGLGGEQRAKYTESLVKMNQYGPGVTQLFNEMQMHGGPVNKASAAQLAAMGSAAGAFNEYSRAVKEGRSEQEIQTSYQRFQSEYYKNINSELTRNAVMLAGNNAAQNEYAKATLEQRQALKSLPIAEQAQLMMEQQHSIGQLTDKNIDYFTKIIQDEALATKTQAEAGAKGTEISRAMNEANMMIATTSAAIGREMSNIVRNTETFNKILEGINEAYGKYRTVENVQAAMGGDLRKVAGQFQDDKSKADAVANKYNLQSPGAVRTDSSTADKQDQSLVKILSDKFDVLISTMSDKKGSTTATTTTQANESSTLETLSNHMLNISNNIKSLLDSSQESVRQLKNVSSGVRNNIGAN